MSLTGSVHGERADFAGLVLGCIEANFCNPLFAGKFLPKSTQFIPVFLPLSNLKLLLSKRFFFSC